MNYMALHKSIERSSQLLTVRTCQRVDCVVLLLPAAPALMDCRLNSKNSAELAPQECVCILITSDDYRNSLVTRLVNNKSTFRLIFGQICGCSFFLAVSSILEVFPAFG